MNAQTLRNVIEEIAPEVVGRRIARAYSIRGRCLVLELATPRPRFLVIVTERALPTVFLGRQDDGIPPSPGGAVPSRLERELAGATVSSIEAVQDALAVALSTSWTGEAGQRIDRTVRIELPRARRAEPEALQDAARNRASPNDAARRAFTDAWPKLDLEERRRALKRSLARELGRKLRAIERVRSELADAERAAEYSRKGQLLLARQAAVRRGASSVVLEDFDGTTRIEIELNPALTAAKNAEVYFGRARKAGRRAKRAPQRLAEIEGDARRLEGLVRSLAAASVSDLTALEAELLPPPRERIAAPAGERARFRTYTVSGGWEVLVGKSNRDNDILSHKIARPDDLWFHVRQAPGSHVVLRRAGRKAEPDKEAILEAAAIAAFHSKAGKSSKVAVCYTEKRHVRKPRGAKPGLAVVSREKVVLVKPKLPEG